MSDAREQIERNADAIRDELARTVRELDRRRLQMADVRGRIGHHAGRFLGAAVVVGAGLASVAAYAYYHSHFRSQNKSLPRQRMKLLHRAWNRPREFSGGEELSPGRVAKRLAFVLAVAVGTQLVRRAVTRIIPERPRSDD